MQLGKAASEHLTKESLFRLREKRKNRLFVCNYLMERVDIGIME